MRENVKQKILDRKLIAIVRDAPDDSILPLTQALLKGGISLVEVTFDQNEPFKLEVTTQRIASILKEFGANVAVGAGTVMTVGQLIAARDAGAQYIISPNVNPSIIRATKSFGLVSIPGAMTPTECALAIESGADFVKLFPANFLGPDYLKSILAPLSSGVFLCVGGMTPDIIPAFLKAGARGFGVGGKLIDKDWIQAGEFEKITLLAQEYVKAVTI
jgi:2-dehydro-3-deoxyphosphogluconate aldolase/(4S)-4-hydroxy-2-oxoglutarate aldolase